MKTMLIRWSLMIWLLLLAVPPLHAEETEGTKEVSSKVEYKVGEGLQVTSADGSRQINFQERVQGRFTYNALDAVADTETFAIQRGKIRVFGFVFEKRLQFGLQINLATRNAATTTAVCLDAGCTKTANAVTAEGTTGLATLEDFFIDWVPTETLGIKFGQFDVPFLIQQLTSDGKQQFVDRSLATDFFNFGRDIGISLHGNLSDHFGYAIFVVNGEGVNNLNRNKAVLTGLRLEFPILGKYSYSESDSDDSDKPNLGAGLAYAFNKSANATQGGTIAAGTKASHATIDLGYKHKGWSFQGAGMLTRTHETAAFTNWGYNGQAGWFVIPKKFEVVGKAGGTIFSGAVPNQYEYASGFNYFIKGHPIKLQTDYTFLINNRGQDLKDHRIRTQMQVTF
ncbi:MAG: hypothetical protein HYS22_06780 [Deltaproteobacteria bacterium]|nr:hypothetical protein [Deltaproteobacteria bacterium]